jgi:hypothetical protein
MEEEGLTVKEYPDGRIKIDKGTGTKTVDIRNLNRLLGDTDDDATGYTAHDSHLPVDIHNEMRYIYVTS